MKDRWKILIISIVIALFLIMIIVFIGSSFKAVELREYGIMYHQIFSDVQNQTARTNGNYLVGLDHSFYTFPRGIISYQYNIIALTKDKSMITVEGFFAGRLVKGQIMAMFEHYGFQYQQFMRKSIQQFTRQAIEQFSLSELISKRKQVANNIKGYVCLNSQTKYAWLQCDYVSIGNVAGNVPRPQVLPVETTFEEKQVQLLNEEIFIQKKYNVYTSGGGQLLKNMEQIQSQLFYNITKKITTNLGNITDPITKVNAASFFLNSPNYKTIKNQFQIPL